MKKLFGILGLTLALTFMVSSCGDDTPAVGTDKTEKKCCKAKEKCDHKADSSKHEACPPNCEKPCCAKKEAKKCCKKDSAKTCSATDSAVCAEMKAKCAKDCGTDSICETHKAECQAKCAAKSDSTSVNNCAADCTKPCCSGEEKKACEPDCEKTCCAS